MDRSDRPEIVPAAIDAFCFAGELIAATPIPGGHIHQNILVTCRGGRYVLQRLNDVVFTDIGLLISNVERVVTHLQASGRRCPELVPARRGTLSFRAPDGSSWRAFHYLEDTVGRETPTGPGDAYEAGRAFADYLVALATLPGPPLPDTIAGFHDLRRRMTALDTVAAADPVGRRSDVGSEIDRARRLARTVSDALAVRGVPSCVRIVHNDAKLSNMRFDAVTDRAVSVVDYDTTMTGYVRHDIGELVRTTTTRSPEDASDETRVAFDLELLEALSSGYFAAGLILDASEMQTVALAGPEMAVENGLRFLADHLAGDRYFSVVRPGQNLDRSRIQLRLTELMLEKSTDIEACFARTSRCPADGAPASERTRNSL